MAELHVFNNLGYTYKSWLLLAPIACAALVSISRTMDYRHHATDVIAGSIIGIIGAWWGYRQYFPASPWLAMMLQALTSSPSLRPCRTSPTRPEYRMMISSHYIIPARTSVRGNKQAAFVHLRTKMGLPRLALTPLMAHPSCRGDKQSSSHLAKGQDQYLRPTQPHRLRSTTTSGRHYDDASLHTRFGKHIYQRHLAYVLYRIDQHVCMGSK